MADTALDVTNLIVALQAAWQHPHAGRRQFGSPSTTLPAYRPIAGSPEDQETPAGVENPYWDVARWMPAEPDYYPGSRLEPTFVYGAFPAPAAKELDAIGASRHTLASYFAWSLVTPGDVQWMTTVLGEQPVVEVGAGTGYWAWQLEQAGVDVAAYDPYPPAADNQFCHAGPYTTVLQDDATAVRYHQDRALLMVWPPYGGEHARHALSLYTGDLLIYAGESHGGCTADDGFYELLDAEWEQASVSEQHVTWWGVHCRLAAYERRGKVPRG